jgi:hypothetical protein
MRSEAVATVAVRSASGCLVEARPRAGLAASGAFASLPLLDIRNRRTHYACCLARLKHRT